MRRVKVELWLLYWLERLGLRLAYWARDRIRQRALVTLVVPRYVREEGTRRLTRKRNP